MREGRKRRLSPTKQEIRSSIIEWNNKYPLDFWWRKKYEIPFGSEEHKGITFLQQVVDYEEDKMMEEYRKNSKEAEEQVEINEFTEEDKKKVVQMTEAEVDKEFDDLDISQYAD